MTNPSIYLSYHPEVQYPDGNNEYSPSEHYPEYPFSDKNSDYISNSQDGLNQKNLVYPMIRECFYGMGYDKEHYGGKEWNPLGDLIKPSNTVLIKPNWVMHHNEEPMDDMNCLVTHPSVVRAVVDYVCIALKGTGKIILADAPMQGCDLPEMFRRSGYDELFAFWRQNGVNIEVVDLRKYRSVFKNGVIVEKQINKDNGGSIKVSVGTKSLHDTEEDKRYKVSDYDCEETQRYHNRKNHIYDMNKNVLLADVVINIPKPKCHRLAGVTGAMKNFVGTIYEKSSLPHRVEGSKEEGGDAYLKKNRMKSWMEYFDDVQTKLWNEGRMTPAHICNFLHKAFYVLGSAASGDKIRVGSWYGNDTIWRTVGDLNQIVKYADKAGNLSDVQQRKILCVGDMIICGQKNGPVKPSAKYLGMIMMSEETIVFDSLLVKIMGFRRDAVKSVSDDCLIKRLGYTDEKEIMEKMVSINGEEGTLKKFKGNEKWRFEPHDSWKGHIEA